MCRWALTTEAACFFPCCYLKTFHFIRQFITFCGKTLLMILFPFSVVGKVFFLWENGLLCVCIFALLSHAEAQKTNFSPLKEINNACFKRDSLKLSRGLTNFWVQNRYITSFDSSTQYKKRV